MSDVMRSTTYRSAAAAAELRWQTLEAAAREELGDMRTVVHVVGRRVGRVAGGITAALCGVSAMGLAIADGVMEAGDGFATTVLLAGLPLGVIVALIARAVTVGVVRRRLEAVLTPSRQPLDDVARLETQGPHATLSSWLTRLAQPSFAWPLVGFAMVAPLLSHLVVYAIAGGGDTSLARFTTWIALSAVIALGPHVAFVVTAVLHAERLVVGEHFKGWVALLCVTAASLVPGVFLLGISTLITLFTALALVPTSFAAVRSIANQERALLAAR